MNCKSCKKNTEGKFCSNCGQKTNTHRLDFKHFMEHDIVHGVFHLDKGLLYTVKEILSNPPKVAIEYINGRRKPYYNFFYILLLLSGLFIILMPYVEFLISKGSPEEQKDAITTLKYFKVYIFAYVPFYALCAWFILRRLKYNFLEHCIIAVIATISLSIVNLIGLGFMMGFHWLNVDGKLLLTIINLIVGVLMIIYPVWTYYGIAKGHYNKWNLYLRIAATIISAHLLIAIFVKTLTTITA